MASGCIERHLVFYCFRIIIKRRGLCEDGTAVTSKCYFVFAFPNIYYLDMMAVSSLRVRSNHWPSLTNTTNASTASICYITHARTILAFLERRNNKKKTHSWLLLLLLLRFNLKTKTALYNLLETGIYMLK